MITIDGLTFGQRIEKFLKQTTMKQKDLAKKAGISPTALNYYIKDKREPSILIITNIAQALDVSADDLLGLNNSSKLAPTDMTQHEQAIVNTYRNNIMARLAVDRVLQLQSDSDSLLVERLFNSFSDFNTLKNFLNIISDAIDKTPQTLVTQDIDDEIDYISLKVYDQPSTAGLGNYLDNVSYEELQFPRDEVTQGTDFGIRIRGDSMEPEIPDGCIAFVRECVRVDSGTIGIFIYDDESYCKRIIIDDERHAVLLTSENKDYADIVIRTLDWLRTVGEVIGYYERKV